MTNTQNPALVNLDLIEKMAHLRVTGYNGESPNPEHHTYTLKTLDDIERQANHARAAVVRNMRAQGLTWFDIGEALGTSRQAAQQRYGR
ncbi:hypothetical protein E3T37_16545 [Cryobacterium sp. TMT2-10]|uniref:hypothetical protein n=1 Tax=Cryobacterium sp. TMT2-10 TaxID=1259244 RepID=UPI00106BC721|nr:hypothetical protein [Cryobacterium sp. TMT2-10]TFD34706.1 hypothetical protein E3T37_16545 [Cryobacterium sp. TMT2-10]